MTLQVQTRGGISMYVHVHVTVHDLEKLMDVFRSALVKEYNEKTGILFENNILKMKLYFENTPPQDTIYSFCECGNITYLEYNYQDNEAYCNNNSENSSKEILTNAGKNEEENSEKADGEIPNNSPPTASIKGKYVAKEKSRNIPAFTEIAEKSNSKSEFLDGIISFLEVPCELHEAFIQIVEIYPELNKATWENILATLDAKEVPFNSYNRRVLCDLATKKLHLRFINVIASINHILSEHNYNNHMDIGNADEKGEAEQITDVTENPENGDQKDTKELTQVSTEKRQVIFECMPPITESLYTEHVKGIEDMLKAIVDSEDNFDLRVEKATITLVSKCLSPVPNEKAIAELIHFTLKAINTMEYENYNYLKPETITDDKLVQNIIRMQVLTWSTIANNLAKYYDSDFSGKITSTKFLSDLKKFLQ